MDVSPTEEIRPTEPRGARARTRKLMLETAIGLMQRGQTPSVSDVAEAAQVSRATAYRYFPSQAALVHAVVDEALGPILDWRSDSTDAEARVNELLTLTMPRVVEFEATFKAALKLSLEQWAQRRAGTLGEEPPFKRGHRVHMLQLAIAPLKSRLPEAKFQRLAMALSLVYGLEVLIVLKDLWGAEFDAMQDVATWAAGALVRAAVADAGT
ncbi:MAG: TetR/AcrR family transcriptional regulator [Devosia sp.]|uniref:TetR/AcrR family transcriptional regulator n=1 Tax=Devosia sp. TaxID=1871048 RepID=UPI001AC61309|nr:TetR/AcrR family transcriptional regulator [Devosia sp.]MBN9308229.1 TetR/AcrR family transcriptional regulator [Devosia sp.]MBN9314992.1 TetR/AcrR family transcriptional regulator [Devosia sp.]